MLSYNEIIPKKYIVVEGEPYLVIESHVFRKQQRKPVNQTKIKNLISGKTIPMTFHVQESVEEADMGAREIKYLYSNKGEWWFSAPDNPKERFSLAEDVLPSGAQFLKENSIVEALTFNDEIIGLTLPAKVDLKVKDAPPSIKGNTATGGTKPVTLETGAVVNAPLFIDVGDVIRVNTETGNYTERVVKG